MVSETLIILHFEEGTQLCSWKFVFSGGSRPQPYAIRANPELKHTKSDLIWAIDSFYAFSGWTQASIKISTRPRTKEQGQILWVCGFFIPWTLLLLLVGQSQSQR